MSRVRGTGVQDYVGGVGREVAVDYVEEWFSGGGVAEMEVEEVALITL